MLSMEPAIARRALRCAVMKLPVFAYRDVGYESREFLIHAGAGIGAVVTHEDDPGRKSGSAPPATWNVVRFYGSC